MHTLMHIFKKNLSSKHIYTLCNGTQQFSDHMNIIYENQLQNKPHVT